MVSERIAFYKDHFLFENEKVLPLNHRGLLFGDGIFSSLKVNNGVVEYYYLHIERLKKQCQAVNIICPPIEKDWIETLIEKNCACEGEWKLKLLVTVEKS